MLIIGSNKHKREAEVAPKYLVPSCKSETAIMEHKKASKNKQNQIGNEIEFSMTGVKTFITTIHWHTTMERQNDNING